jgi:hypothetical protein
LPRKAGGELAYLRPRGPGHTARPSDSAYARGGNRVGGMGQIVLEARGPGGAVVSSWIESRGSDWSFCEYIYRILASCIQCGPLAANAVWKIEDGMELAAGCYLLGFINVIAATYL